MAKIIFTADDYGFCDEVDAGVIMAIDNGLISSVASFANGPNWEKRLEELRNAQERYMPTNNKVPGIDIGCHLTITSGEPVSDVAKRSFFLTKNGRFRKYTALSRPKTEASRVALKAVIKREIEAQIEQMESAGIKVAHLSSHHDTLTFFEDYYQALLEVADEKKIPIRSPFMKPDERENKYFKQIGLRLQDNLSKRDEKDYKQFRLTRHKWFRENLNKYANIPGVPNSIWGGNYVTRSVFLNVVNPQFQANIAETKSEKLLKAIKEQSKDDVVEYCVHICSPLVNVKQKFDFKRKETPHYYSGVNAGYFDGRQIEYKSLERLKQKLEREENAQFIRWDKLNKPSL